MEVNSTPLSETVCRVRQKFRKETHRRLKAFNNSPISLGSRHLSGTPARRVFSFTAAGTGLSKSNCWL